MVASYPLSASQLVCPPVSLLSRLQAHSLPGKLVVIVSDLVVAVHLAVGFLCLDTLWPSGPSCHSYDMICL